eukprot:scaffold5748_cov124-Isochrysis_galbana.AAC.3
MSTPRMTQAISGSPSAWFCRRIMSSLRQSGEGRVGKGAECGQRLRLDPRTRCATAAGGRAGGGGCGRAALTWSRFRRTPSRPIAWIASGALG